MSALTHFLDSDADEANLCLIPCTTCGHAGGKHCWLHPAGWGIRVGACTACSCRELVIPLETYSAWEGGGEKLATGQITIAHFLEQIQDSLARAHRALDEVAARIESATALGQQPAGRMF